MNTLSPKSIDTVVALDFIEHLTKEEGLAFLLEAERIARKQVIIFTPLGYYPQSYETSDEKDRWGMLGGQWQTHHSGWEPTDFPPEWKIIGCRNFHMVDQHFQALEQPHGCIWAIRTFTHDSVISRSIPPNSDLSRTELHLWGVTMLQRYAPLWLSRMLTFVWRYYKKAKA